MKFQLPKLPYRMTALAPFMSRDQLRTHYEGHHRAYVDKVNEAIEKLGIPDITLEKLILNYDGDIFNNAAQAWNHTFFWLGLREFSKLPAPEGKFIAAVKSQFGSLEALRERFIDSGMHVFGSGYTWLVAMDDGKIQVINTPNADNPISREHSHPLWTCDVWEHAYYIDYRKERKEYLERAWDHINWEFVEKNFELKQVPNMTAYMRASDSGKEPEQKSFM